MIDPGGVVAWGLVAAANAVVGWLLARLVPMVLAWDAGGPDPMATAHGRRVRVAALLGGLALWWWEVVAMGQVPLADATAGPLVERYAVHVVLFAFLAAASWIDLRRRVIPDAITVPGTLLGLACSALSPETLLPIAVEVPRSFAPPSLGPDVLGMAGGLHAVGPPWWLEPRPAWTGLAVAMAVVLGWWWSCTVPFVATGRHRGAAALLREPRNLILVAGVAGVAGAWWCGGMAWRGLLAGLAGLGVGAGMIWLTRVGASRALGREAMGFGDVTLMAMMGSWLGWQACVLVCFLAVFIGLAHGVLQMLLHRESELPFGPSLCLAAVLVVVAWRPLWARVGVSFERPLEMAAVIGAVIALTAVSLLVWQRLRSR